MPQNYTPEFKRRLFVSVWRKEEQSTASPLSMASPKKVSAGGAMNSRKNAKPKAFKSLRSRMKQKL